MVRKYADQPECPCSSFTDGVTGQACRNAKHWMWALEQAQKQGAPKQVLARLQELIDLNQDLGALACLIDKKVDGAAEERAVRKAAEAAQEAHYDELLREMLAAIGGGRPSAPGTAQGAPFDKDDLDTA